MKVVEYEYEEYEDEGEYPEKPKKNKRKFGLYGYLVILLAITILAVSFFLVFYLQKIEVTGVEYGTEREVVEWIKSDKYAINSLYILFKHNVIGVKELPFVDKAEVRLKNPWTVSVNIQEKKIVGYIGSDGMYVYFDKEGRVIAKIAEIKEGVPSIEGIEIAKSEQYKILPVENKELFTYIADVTQMTKECALAPERIVYTGLDVSLYFGTICVQLGHENLRDRIVQVSPILASLGGQSGTLHLENYNEKSELISFKKDIPVEEPDPESVASE